MKFSISNKLKTVLSSVGMAIFFGMLGESLHCAALALPFLIYGLTTDSDTKSLFKDYTHRTLKSVYIGTVSIVLLSLRYELKTSCFYAGMNLINRILVALLMSILFVAVIALATLICECLVKKIKNYWQRPKN